MAQRKGELLKMEMLERLAGLHRDLEQEVEIASNAGGASLSAIAVARDLLSLPAKRSGPYEVRRNLCSRGGGVNSTGVVAIGGILHVCLFYVTV